MAVDRTHLKTGKWSWTSWRATALLCVIAWGAGLFVGTLIFSLLLHHGR